MCFDNASSYDKMINWDVRLAREIPLIAEFLENGTVLDMACSSGRHSFALEKLGLKCIGVDIGEGFITIANQIANDNGYKSRFLCFDGSSRDLRGQIQNLGITYFDNAILLGNAIANLGTYDLGKKLLQNIFLLLKPGGNFFIQTVIRPQKPHYLPLRKANDELIQRIMVPYVGNEPHNTELHVNVISDDQYIRQVTNNKFFMYDIDEFEALLRNVGFEVQQTYGSYNKDQVIEEGGSTVLWLVKKPAISISPESLMLFNLDETELINKVLEVWQDLYEAMKYRCIIHSRFVHPRILSHEKYKGIELKEKRILDLGCGLGTDLVQMVVDGADPELCFGIDRENKAIEIHEVLFGNRGIQLYCGDVVTGDIDTENGVKNIYDEKYDIAFAGSLLHLVEEEQVTSICKNIFLALSEGGIFFGRLVVIKEGAVPDSYYSYLHTLPSIRELLTDIGFKNIELIVADQFENACERSYGDHLTVSFYCTK